MHKMKKWQKIFVVSMLLSGYTASPVYALTESDNSAIETNQVMDQPVKISDQTFPDEHFRQHILESVDINRNNLLEGEELLMTTLDISSQSIADLTGIEYFDKLVALNAFGNQLEAVDLSLLPQLKKINLAQNKLTDLKLAEDADLQYFDATAQKVTFSEIKEQGAWKISLSEFQLDMNKFVLVNHTGNIETAEQSIISIQQFPSVLSYQVGTNLPEYQVTGEAKVIDQTLQASLPVTEYGMKLGEEKQIDYQLVSDGDSTKSNVRWESVAPEVASVSKEGLLKGLSSGKTDVILFAEDHRELATIQVSVDETPAASPMKIEDVILEHRGNLQQNGWDQGYQSTGMIGSVGKNRGISGFALQLAGAPENIGDIEYLSLVAGRGWESSFKSKGETSGLADSTTTLEAVKIKLTGQIEKEYDVEYRVHVENLGWLGWAKNGENTGTENYGFKIEAIELKLVKKTLLKKQTAETTGIYFNRLQTQTPTIEYSGHTSNVGWQNPYVANGQVGGTTGRNLQLEALKVRLSDMHIKGDIVYSAHVENIGWQNNVKDDQVAGTIGRVLQVEALRINLSGPAAYLYDVVYRVHSSNFGWLGWTTNGQSAGSVAFNYQAEGFEIKLVPKGTFQSDSKPAFIDKGSMVMPTMSFEAHCADIGWKPGVGLDQVIGTTGENRRVEAFRGTIQKSAIPGSLKYSAHVEEIGWQTPVNAGEIAGTTGRALQVEAVRFELTGELSRYYDIYYRAHVSDFGWLDWAKNGNSAGSEKLHKKVEAFQVKLVAKDSNPPGSTNTPFVSGRHVLFVMGHGDRDPGAIGSGTSEEAFTRNEFLPILKRMASKVKNTSVAFYDPTKNMYKDSQKGGGAYTISRGFQNVIEVHLDSSTNSSISGGHVIVNSKNGNTPLARQISSSIGRYVGWHPSFSRTSGISMRDDLLNLNVCYSRRIPYQLTELGFISNTSDVSRLRVHLESLARDFIFTTTGEIVN